MGVTSFPYESSVPYTSVANTGNTTFVLPRIYTTPMKRVEAQASFGVYKRWLTTFKIDPKAWTLPTPPKLRDSLLIDDVIWTVHRDVDTPRQFGFWRLACIHLEIDANLCDIVSVKPPVDSTDAYDSPLTGIGDAPAWDNLPAHVQFVNEELVDFQGIQYMRPYHNIWVSGLNANLPIGTLVTSSSGQYAGTTFRIIDNANIDSLEELERLYVTVDP
jgi:hypothetical protein